MNFIAVIIVFVILFGVGYIFLHVTGKETKFVPEDIKIISENIPAHVLNYDREFSQLPTHTVYLRMRSPNDTYVIEEKRVGYADWEYTLKNTTSPKAIVTFSLVESDPGSGTSWGVIWSEDSKAIRFKGGTYNRRARQSYGFYYIYLIGENTVYTLSNPGEDY